MNGENRPLITDEPVEFEKLPVEVQDFRKIADHFRGIYGISQHVTGWTWKHYDLDRLCPRISPDPAAEFLESS